MAEKTAQMQNFVYRKMVKDGGRIPLASASASTHIVIPAKAGIYNPAPAESSATLSKRASDASPQRLAKNNGKTSLNDCLFLYKSHFVIR